MKPTFLTNDQVMKLKGMTNVLFPHYSVNIASQKDIYLSRNDNMSINNDVQHFHWFEFCIAVIPPKLFGNSFDRSRGWYAVIENCKAGNSIVDALYSQFEKSCEKELSTKKVYAKMAS
ncbi:MAG: hypothetical protein ACXWDO_03780 [Bacteroidia bacterium]